jgi:hypothetical protein
MALALFILLWLMSEYGWILVGMISYCLGLLTSCFIWLERHDVNAHTDHQ